MFLYHGTSEKHLQSILKHGIIPRSISKKSNWKHTIESNAKLVYLTECYAGYFAICSCKKNEKLLIVEIDISLLDEIKFRPDEDAIAQILVQRSGTKESLISLTKEIRKNYKYYSHFWQESLRVLGNCSYEGIIPVSAITRISKIDLSNNREMFISLSDPTITIMNHRFCSGKYKSMTRWLMGEKITVEEFLGHGFNEEFPKVEEYKQNIQTKILSNQSIEIMYTI